MSVLYIRGLHVGLTWSTYRLGLTWNTYQHFRPSQSHKCITVKWLNSWQTITRGGCVKKASKPPSSWQILFLNLGSEFTYYCYLHEPSLAQQINCNWILFSHTRRWLPASFSLFLYFSFFFWLFYVILLLLIFTKIFLLLFFYYFFMKIIFISSVPGCSGMFRNVLFSGVFRRPFQNRKWKSARLSRASVCKTNAPLKIADRSMAGHFEF